MIAVGIIAPPLAFCEELRVQKQKFSVNEITKAKILICSTLSEFKTLKPYNSQKRVLIFDCVERLQILQGLKIVSHKSVELCVKQALAETKHTEPVSKYHNYIKETIDKNNDASISFLHAYNTNLYRISSVSLRESIRTLYLNFLNGRIDREALDKGLKPLYPKRGKSLAAFEELYMLLDTDLLKRMQNALQKAKGKKDRDIDQIAKDYNVAVFDLNYLRNTKLGDA